MNAFQYFQPTEILFGAGRIDEVGSAVRRFGRRCLLVSRPKAGAFGPSIARIKRLRSADGIPMAIESSALPADILPDPGLVGTSLYALLRANSSAPFRAIQRVAAASAEAENAKLLNLPVGAPILQIDRTGYLTSGRPIEFTCGLYRSDMYDFVTELRVEPNT